MLNALASVFLKEELVILWRIYLQLMVIYFFTCSQVTFTRTFPSASPMTLALRVTTCTSLRFIDRPLFCDEHMLHPAAFAVNVLLRTCNDKFLDVCQHIPRFRIFPNIITVIAY